MRGFLKLYTLLFSLSLCLFTGYALLDSFVIRRVYATVDPPGTAAESSAPAESPQPQALASLGGSSADVQPEAEIGDASYCDENISIRIDSVRFRDTEVYVADILLSSPDYLKTAFSWGAYGRNITAATSDTASALGALLAVNGDNYGSRETGYVIRGGVLYRDSPARDQEDLVIWDDGSFSIIRESEISAQELLDAGAREVFSFGPGLLEDGSITVESGEEVGRAKASNPRTAIGLIGEGHYVLVVSDGRSSESAGLSLYELACFMQELGCRSAYNLDGGGSSTMVFLGDVVNKPSGRNGERSVTDIVYIAA